MPDHLRHGPECGCNTDENDPVAAGERAMQTAWLCCDTDGCRYQGTVVCIEVIIADVFTDVHLCPSCIGEARRQLMADPKLAEVWRG